MKFLLFTCLVIAVFAQDRAVTCESLTGGSCLNTCRESDNDSCKDNGMQLAVPRTKDDFKYLLDTFGNSYFEIASGIYNDVAGQSYTSYTMNSESGVPDWKAVGGGSWWLRDSPYSEPNGDYGAKCWLGIYDWNIDNIRFNDLTGCYCSSKYLCEVPGSGVAGGNQWHMALTIDSGDSRWQYDNAQWASGDLFNDAGNIKTGYYNNAFGSLMLVFNGHTDKAVVWANTDTTKSLRDYMSVTTWYEATGTDTTVWHNANGDGVFGYQNHCNKIGFNTASSGAASYAAHAKFGIVMNQENDCSSGDATIGFGFNDSPYAGGQCTCCQNGGTCSMQGTVVEVYTCTGGACPAAGVVAVPGCMDSTASNYNGDATEDDGSCLYPGCTDSTAVNYNSAANQDDGSCTYAGCIDSTAMNYDATKVADDGSCVYSCGHSTNGYTCPAEKKFIAAYESTQNTGEDACCELRMCSEFVCHDTEATHKPGASAIAGIDHDTCCTCTYGSALFYGAVASGDYNPSGADNSGQPTMSITLPIPSDITVTGLTWVSGDSTMDYTPAVTNEWTVVAATPCRNDYTLTHSVAKFFGAGSKWDISGANLYSTITMAGTKAVTQTFNDVYTETYTRTLTHAIGLRVSMTTTTSVEANFFMKEPVGVEEYVFVTGIVDNYAADNSEPVRIIMTVKSGECVKDEVTLNTGTDYVSGVVFTMGAASLDNKEDTTDPSHDLCDQQLTFEFVPNACFSEPVPMEVGLITRNDYEFVVNVVVDIECASFLDNLPINAGLTFHEATTDLVTQKTSYMLGQEVYCLLATSTLVPVDSIVIDTVVMTQTGYADETVVTNLKPEENAALLYTDSYPAAAGMDHAVLMSWDLESTTFTVTESGAPATVEVAFTVEYDQGYTFRRRMEVEMKESEISQQTFGNNDAAKGQFEILSETGVGVFEIGEATMRTGRMVVAGAGLAAAGAGLYYYNSATPEKSQLLENEFHSFDFEDVQ